MTALVIAWAITLPPTFLVGWAFGRRHRKPPTLKHQHIWDQWERIQISESRNGRRVPSGTAQERRCLDCGYRQVERDIF